MNHQNNRSSCSCGGENRCNTCPYGRTPWSSRENSCSCGRRPWNTRNTCNRCAAARTGTCPSTANTTWKNRGAFCPCNTAGTDTCSCNEARETRNTCSCAEIRRDGNCDEDCNHGAKNTGLLSGKSLAMVYSPYQDFDSLYDPRQGLCKGTIFGTLDKPFHGDRRGC